MLLLLCGPKLCGSCPLVNGLGRAAAQAHAAAAGLPAPTRHRARVVDHFSLQAFSAMHEGQRGMAQAFA